METIQEMDKALREHGKRITKPGIRAALDQEGERPIGKGRPALYKDGCTAKLLKRYGLNGHSTSTRRGK